MSRDGSTGIAVVNSTLAISVTIGMEGDELTIHALTPAAREGLATGDMDRRVTSVEGGG